MRLWSDDGSDMMLSAKPCSSDWSRPVMRSVMVDSRLAGLMPPPSSPHAEAMSIATPVRRDSMLGGTRT